MLHIFENFENMINMHDTHSWLLSFYAAEDSGFLYILLIPKKGGKQYATINSFALNVDDIAYIAYHYNRLTAANLKYRLLDVIVSPLLI